MGHPLRGAAAITGLGMTPMGRIYKSTMELAADATRSALADAGLKKDQVDGLLINAGITGMTGGTPIVQIVVGACSIVIGLIMLVKKTALS